MVDGKAKNPAIGFLFMAGFNVLATITFVVFYFFNAVGERSYWFLIAAVVLLFASAGSIVAYNYFRTRMQSFMK